MEEAINKQGVKKEEFPYFRINRNAVEALMFNLHDFITPVYPGELKISSLKKPEIKSQNTYSKDQKICMYDDQKRMVYYYDLLQQQQFKNDIPQQLGELPYQPSYVATNEGKLIICGGVNQKGQILSSTLEHDLLSAQNRKISDMKVKRVGHSLVFVQNPNDLNGFVYAIGGRVNDKTRTKLCERYNTQTKNWEKIANLNFARSRCCTCVVNGKFIYAFYGTNSFGKSVPSIEKFDIQTNEWLNLEVVTHLPGYDVTYGSSLQINNDQILIFGGFRDSMFFDSDMIMNRKLVSFNISNNSVSLFDHTLPVDFISQGQPICLNNEIYAVGGFMNQNGLSPQQNMEYFYLVQINNAGVKVLTSLNPNLADSNKPQYNQGEQNKQQYNQVEQIKPQYN